MQAASQLTTRCSYPSPNFADQGRKHPIEGTDETYVTKEIVDRSTWQRWDRYLDLPLAYLSGLVFVLLSPMLIL